MALEPVLIAGEWRQPANPTGSFKAIDPTAGKPLPESYPVSSIDDVTAAIRAAEEAALALRAIPVDAIGRFLDDYASRIEAAADALVSRAALETGLPVTPRLRNVELPRTTNQLRQGAAAARDRSWTQATIDTKANLRSYYGPLGGPVVVFGPNNFPFAFNSVAGGDFVAAIAAGNPVIGKANTGHPGTSKLLAELALEAARAAGLPPAMVQLVYRTPPDVGFVLVSDARVAATGFTGSKSAGLKLKAAADRAGKPIYLEMSSTNPVFVLPRALDERGAAIAKELYDSCAMGAGQFCTRPGLAVVPKGDKGAAFVAELAGLFKAGTAGTLLGPSGATAIAAALKELVAGGARVLAGGRPVDGDRAAFEPTLLEVSAKTFLDKPHELQTEAFGTVNTVVVADDVAQMAAVAADPGRQPDRLRVQRHDRQGRRRLRAPGARVARQGRAAAQRQDADRRRRVAGDEPRRPVPGDRPPRLHGRRHPGVAAALRVAALLRRGPPAPPARRAREQEPDREDVAADRRQLVAGGRSRVTATASSPASLGEILGTGELLATTRTKAKGPEGRLPITAKMLLEEPSGNLFGMTQDAGMGWNPAEVGRPQSLIVSTQGGMRAEDGSPVALGFHTGHWEIGLLVREAAAGAARRGRGAVRGVRQRSVRRPHAGDDGHVRQPAVPQRRRDHDAAADPVAAAPVGRHRDRDLRQGAARDAAGAGRLARLSRHRRAGRRDAAGGRRRGRGQGADDRRALRARPDHRRRGRRHGLPRVRHAGRRLPVPGHGRDRAGGGRGVRDDAAAQRARAVGRAGLAGHGAALGARAGAPAGDADAAVGDPDAGRA